MSLAKTYLLGVFLIAGTVCGCKKDAPPPVAPVQNVRQANYQEFAALNKATSEVVLPFIIGSGADNDEPCFIAAMGIEPMAADVVVQGLIENNQKAVNKAIIDWVLNDLEPDALSPVLAKNWNVAFEDLVVMEVPADQLFFEDNPQCLSSGGWLPDTQHLITTVIGAKGLVFNSDIPLNDEIKTSIKQAATARNIKMESDALFEYEPAVNEDGTPVTNHEGKPLYTSPDGIHISEEDIPSAVERRMTEWTFSFEQPLYFGVKEIPDGAWRKENDKDACDIIVIADDPAPRKPECPEFQESAFSVSIVEGEEKPVSITITTGQENKGVLMDWNESTKIQLNDRIIMWLKVQKVEVGVNLKLNSITLNPMPMEGDGPVDVASYAQDVPVESKASEEKNKKKKRKKGSSQNVLDAYLSE